MTLNKSNHKLCSCITGHRVTEKNIDLPSHLVREHSGWQTFPESAWLCQAASEFLWLSKSLRPRLRLPEAEKGMPVRRRGGSGSVSVIRVKI